MALTRQTLMSFHRTISSVTQTVQFHASLIKTGLNNDTHFITKLISLYANNHCFNDATLFLNSVPEPDIFAFSTLIHAFSKVNKFNQTINVFSHLLYNGLLPDCRVLPSLIKVSGGLFTLKFGKQIHGFATVSGFCSDLLVQSSLVHFYMKCDRISDAHKVFDKITKRDVVTWSALVSGYAKIGYIKEAKKEFHNMERSGVEPNLISWNGMIAGFNRSGLYAEVVSMFKKLHSRVIQPDGVTMSSVLPAVGDLEDVNMGIQIHGYVIKQGLHSDKCVVSALIDMYGKCARSSEMSRVFDEIIHFDVESCNAFIAGLSRNGLADEALKVFDQIRSQGVQPSVVSWTSTIACCSQNAKDIEAIELFREMQISGVEPNAVTIPCLLPACGNIAALMHGKATHCFSLRRGISNNIYVGSAMIDMYAKCGEIQASRLYFNEMTGKNRVCWNTMMGGYAIHGMANEALQIFDLMLKSGQKPDFITFTSILSACSQNGLTKEGWHYFNCMTSEYGIEARVEHYACMVTLLGRAGKLEEAYSVIKKMPLKPDACVWGALLSSCKVYNNLKIGEVAVKKLFMLEPTNPGNHILLSNIYAAKGMWSKAGKVRNMMNNMGLTKNPGGSWIEVKNKIHMLLAGDTLHPDMDQIIEKLNELTMEMMKFGYVPATTDVLEDEEEMG